MTDADEVNKAVQCGAMLLLRDSTYYCVKDPGHYYVKDSGHADFHHFEIVDEDLSDD